MPRVIAALVMTVLLAACGGGGGNETPSTRAADPTINTLSVASSYTGMTYPIKVYLPAGYATSTAAKPVIYAMDDELQGLEINTAVASMHLDVIIVTIGSLGSARRFIDFDLPGATDYLKFLTLEVIPRVEAQYRIDSSRRTLMGYSLSGLMAMIALLEDGPSPRYFSGYVMTDPSLQLHTQELVNLEQKLFDTTHDLPVRVHHCSIAADSPSAQLQDKIQARGYQGLHYDFQLYLFMTHATVLAPCVRDGLKWVFGT